jgi:hypothetical protein
VVIDRSGFSTFLEYMSDIFPGEYIYIKEKRQPMIGAILDQRGIDGYDHKSLLFAAQGERILHRHLCEYCGNTFEHAHIKREYEEYLKFVHTCRRCKNKPVNSLKVQSLNSNFKAAMLGPVRGLTEKTVHTEEQFRPETSSKLHLVAQSFNFNGKTVELECPPENIFDDKFLAEAENTDLEKLTKFDEAVEETVAVEQNNSLTLYKIGQPVNLPNYIERPYQIYDGLWISTNTYGTKLFDLSFPQILYLKTMLTAHLGGAAFWRPNFRVKIRLNSTSQHYGRILICWVPCPDDMNPSYDNIASASSFPWVQIDANKQETCEIDLPFAYFRDYLNVGGNVYDMYAVRGYVSVPLSIATGVTPPSVGFMITCQIYDPELREYNFSNNFTVESFSSVKINKTLKGLVADNINKTSEVVDDIGSSSRVLSKPYHSVQPNLRAVMPVIDRGTIYGRIDDLPTTEVVGPHQTAETDMDFGFVNDTPDCMDIIKIISRPALLQTIRIQSSVTSGVTIWRQLLSPRWLINIPLDNVYNPTAFVGLPIEFVSRFFSLWRGGLRFHFSFACSMFHSLRVKIYWVPRLPEGTNWTTASLSLDDTFNVVNTIIDIKQQKDYSLTIPFNQLYAWRPVGTYTTVTPSIQMDYANGYIGMSIINELTSSSAITPDIFCQIFCSAAPDFEFSMNSTNYMDADFAVESEVVAGQDVTPCLSTEYLMNKDYPSFAKQSVRVYHGKHVATKITSVKQLASILTPFLTITPPGGVQIYTDGDYGTANSALPGNYCYFIALWPLFRFWRGGIRFVADGNSSALRIGYTIPYSNNFGGTFFSNFTPLNINNVSNYDLLGHAVVYRSDFQLNDDFIIPYYGATHCKLMKVNRDTIDTIPATGLIFNYTSALGTQNCYMAVGPDFMFGSQLGIPQCTRVRAY